MEEIAKGCKNQPKPPINQPTNKPTHPPVPSARQFDDDLHVPFSRAKTNKMFTTGLVSTNFEKITVPNTKTQNMTHDHYEIGHN